MWTKCLAVVMVYLKSYISSWFDQHHSYTHLTTQGLEEFFNQVSKVFLLKPLSSQICINCKLNITETCFSFSRPDYRVKIGQMQLIFVSLTIKALKNHKFRNMQVFCISGSTFISGYRKLLLCLAMILVLGAINLLIQFGS